VNFAARNVLLSGATNDELVAKVCDFGMARSVESAHTGAEQQTRSALGPIKWMAPEQLERLSYSKMSDVFALGVLLFEIFARSAPWAGVAAVNVMVAVVRGERMEVPAAVPRGVRDIVAACWRQTPGERPKSSAVAEQLAALLDL
jgi:serine/threonine protein kinase